MKLFNPRFELKSKLVEMHVELEHSLEPCFYLQLKREIKVKLNNALLARLYRVQDQLDNEVFRSIDL